MEAEHVLRSQREHFVSRQRLHRVAEEPIAK
jgi:hypothetical protein